MTMLRGYKFHDTLIIRNMKHGPVRLCKTDSGEKNNSTIFNNLVTWSWL